METVHAETLETVLPLFRYVEEQVSREHLHAAGFVAYEAAPAFDPALMVRPATEFPLLWFRLFEECSPIAFPTPLSQSPRIGWSPSLSEGEYSSAVHRIREHIREGDTYQTNFSFRLNAPAPADPWEYFVGMVKAQGAGYGAFLDAGRWVICSASPELFIRLDGDLLTSKPMKGTAPRGLLPDDDLRQAEWLTGSEKNRAENLMIVDMVRNDMGRIAEVGSVVPGGLFEAEQYPTLWQMTSTIRCRTTSSLADIFTALFPAASITGAPKVRTTEIIRVLETTARRIYTGAIGFISPGRVAQFNVAIRTVLVDTARRAAEYGTGSGIVWDSESHSEFEECLLKAEILSHSQPGFDLLETMRWTPDDGYLFLDRHMTRLGKSCVYFDRPFEADRILNLLDNFSGGLPPHPHKVRLRLPEYGDPAIDATALGEQPEYRIRLAEEPIDRTVMFLYHKTTNRTVYESALDQAAGYDDVLLWNEEGEVTESCIANIVVEKDGALITPPVRCGLLPGVYRSHLLEEGSVRESVVRKEDLPRCSRIFLVNSVRLMWEVRLQGTEMKSAEQQSKVKD